MRPIDARQWSFLYTTVNMACLSFLIQAFSSNALFGEGKGRILRNVPKVLWNEPAFPCYHHTKFKYLLTLGCNGQMVGPNKSPISDRCAIQKPSTSGRRGKMVISCTTYHPALSKPHRKKDQMKPTERYAYSRNGDQGRVDEKCLVRVQVPTVDSSIDGKVRYHVRVTNVRSGLVWEVARRFSEFLKLRNELIEFFANTDKKCPGCRNYEKVLKLFEFPRKHVFTSVTPVVINYRKKALRSFVALLASHTFTTTPKCPTCCGFPFTGVRDWLTTDMVAGAGVASNVPGGSPTNESIRDTMNVKDFTKYHPVTDSMPVDQEGRFVGSSALKYASSSTTMDKEYKRESRSPPRSQAQQLTPKEDPLKSPLRYTYSGSDSSTDSINESISSTQTPGSAMKENYIEGEDDEQEFESFVASSVTSLNASRDRKHTDQPACEPLGTENDSIGGEETVKKEHFKFARSSIGAADSERLYIQPRESSLIGIDDSDDDVEEEGLNMDL